MNPKSRHNDYMGSRYSQHMFPEGEINDTKDFKEESLDDERKDQFWNQVMTDSNYEGKFTIGKLFLNRR
jgi:hypothetical protein